MTARAQPGGQSRVVRIDGLRELSRAFAVADRRLSREFRKGLRSAAEPIRADAESLAVERISRIGLEWSRMRTGVSRTSVYVAPRKRGSKTGAGKRRNLFDLLGFRSLEPALDRNIDDVSRRVDGVLETVGRAWETA